MATPIISTGELPSLSLAIAKEYINMWGRVHGDKNPSATDEEAAIYLEQHKISEEYDLIEEISTQETIDKVINYCNGCKYREPQDENERGFNRGIDRVVNTIENYINC